MKQCFLAIFFFMLHWSICYFISYFPFEILGTFGYCHLFNVSIVSRPPNISTPKVMTNFHEGQRRRYDPEWGSVGSFREFSRIIQAFGERTVGLGGFWIIIISSSHPFPHLLLFPYSLIPHTFLQGLHTSHGLLYNLHVYTYWMNRWFVFKCLAIAF